MSTLRMGTCSWKYPSWHGLVYSQRDKINYLEEYASRFNTVEVDQWFWSLFGTDAIALPKLATVSEYAAAVPEDFRFTIKAPNSITLTHFYRKGNQKGTGPNPYFLSVPLLRDFLSSIEALRDLTGSVMLQFEYLNKQKMPTREAFTDRLGQFLEAIAADPDCSGWPLSIEIRNPNYLADPYLSLLERHDIPHVFCHGYYLPPAFELYRKFEGRFRGPSVIRLLGPDRSGIEETTGKKWDRIVAPRDDELPDISDMITQMLSAGVDVIVNVNNHYEGSAPLTIEKLEKLIDQRRGE